MAQNPEATVVFGVLNETSETESRVVDAGYRHPAEEEWSLLDY